MNDNRSAFTRFSIQVLWIILGYALASIATGFYVSGILAFDPLDGLRPSGSTVEYVSFGFFVALLVSFYAAPWAFLTIAWGEYKSWRMWWYYAAAGALIGMLLEWLFMSRPTSPLAGLAFGPVAGAIFWFFAGKKAGGHGAARAVAIVFVLLALILLLPGYAPIMRGFR
jgi:hypothetical protein